MYFRNFFYVIFSCTNSLMVYFSFRWWTMEREIILNGKKIKLQTDGAPSQAVDELNLLINLDQRTKSLVGNPRGQERIVNMLETLAMAQKRFPTQAQTLHFFVLSSSYAIGENHENSLIFRLNDTFCQQNNIRRNNGYELLSLHEEKACLLISPLKHTDHAVFTLLRHFPQERLNVSSIIPLLATEVSYFLSFDLSRR